MSVSKVCVRIPDNKKQELLRLADTWRKSSRKHGPGWDAKIIHRIAKEQYGGLEAMFKAHDWPERGKAMMPKVQWRVCESYGTVKAFAKKHGAKESWQEDSPFPFGVLGPLKHMSDDPDALVRPTDDDLLDKMGL